MARTPRAPKNKPDWKPAWLEAFRVCGTVSGACKVVNIGRRTVYDARNRDEEFAQAWQELEDTTTDRMEREAFRRAVEGVERDIYFKGDPVGTERQFSDTLLIFMLKARKPQIYRENVHIQHGGEVAQRVTVEIPHEQDWHQQVAAVLADVGALDGHNGNGNGSGNGA